MLSSPDLAGSMVSADGRVVLVVAQLVPNTEDAATREDLRGEIDRRLARVPGVERFAGGQGGAARRLEIAKQLSMTELIERCVEVGFPPAAVHAGGFTVAMHFLLQEGARNLEVMFPLTTLLIVLSLVWLMRRPLDVILPLLCVGPAVVCTMGLGGMVFDRLSIISTISPVMVLVVGVSDVVHLVTQFRHERARGLGLDDAICVAFRQVGAACALTSLTTFIGFGSMWFLPLPPSRELGVFAAIGVVMAFALSFLLTPVLLSFTAEGSVAAAPARQPGARLTALLERLAGFVNRRAKAVTLAGMVVTVVVAGAVSQVQVENGLVQKLARDHPMRRSAAVMTQALGGGAQLEILVDSGAAGGLKDPAVLAGLDAVLRKAAGADDTGEATSYVDVIRRIHAILGPEGAARLPTDRALVAQYLLLFEMQGGDDLAPVMDHTRRHARAFLRLGDLTAEEVVALARRIDRWGVEHLPAGASLETSGLGLLAARFGPRAKDSALRGFAIAMLLIAVLLGLLFRSVKVGVLSIVPNMLPVAFGVTMVAAFYEQVDLDTLNFLAICLGIAVDDTIHFLARFRLERARGLDRPEAVRATMLEAGHGIVRTSVVLTAGFAVSIAADYMPVSSGGAVLCATLVAAVCADLTLVPAMARLGLLEPGGWGKVGPPTVETRP